MLTYKTSLHDALYKNVEENVNPGLVIAEPGEPNLYFLSETVVNLTFCIATWVWAAPLMIHFGKFCQKFICSLYSTI